MAPSCSPRSDPRRTPKTTEKKRKQNRMACGAAETAEQKEHRVSNPRTKDRARRAASACSYLAWPHPIGLVSSPDPTCHASSEKK